jgi:hypothetical protein
VTVRIPPTLLKSSACLLLGISAVFGCSAANALTTYSLNYSSNTSNSLSGSFTIDESQSSVRAFMVSIPTWLTNLSLIETVSGISTTYQLSDYSTLYWDPNLPVNYNLDLVPQFSSLTFGSSSSAPDASSNFELSSRMSSSTYTLTSANPVAVPGPLPILGIPAVLLYSRNLKKRIKARRETSEASLA